MSHIRHLVHADPDALATAAARDAVEHLTERIAAAGRASLSLTGGSVGVKTAAALADSTVEWEKVTIFFGDERFVPADHPERNDGQLDEALLDSLGDRPTVHRWPARTGQDSDVDSAAERFLESLTIPAGDDPIFDVTILGMGPEGHIDSIFPHTPAVAETERLVVGVRDCPKPPPERLTFTLPAVRRSRHILVVAAGEGKAEAVAEGIGGASPSDWPVAGAVGTESTTYHLDVGAASALN
ncbi:MULTISPECIES: 6-phosphogluconolactonase [unclassified Dietzia]|uniref:6-phosphogluconolactonase n=1 Tax=unclassified Dietzia TaxID=2617939 RepID=UPI0015F850D2|nr:MULTISPECIES: 6-phosphogluconolactonase [unclassified Dietzia]MBB1040377.1 6-phosphogluconolactonase [Dietzia sp. Cai40]MBB1042963.1 6-phosphogluconolactonase [Dietzia sp. DQ11-44]MBB1057405.1 6-phosphogluconolactonase [Dietzia sp. B19]